MPAISITTEEKITLKPVWATTVPVRKFAALALTAAAFALAPFALPSAAFAGVSGQQEAWTIDFGLEPGEFFNPKQLGVDPVDGSVYVVDGVPGNEEARIDKFSASGTLEGTVSISRLPDEAEATGKKNFVGIVVNHAAHRFYLVQTEAGAVRTDEPLAEERVATKVLAFSTETTAGALAAPVETFTLPANGPDAILLPQELAIDPSNGDLILAGMSPAGKTVLQRISTAGVPGARYEEAGTTLDQETVNYALTVGADGKTYVLAQTGTAGAPNLEGFTLPANFAGTPTLTPIPGFADAATAEGWGSTGGALFVAFNGLGVSAGQQLALVTNPAGEETLFWKANQESSEEEQEIRIHGFSLQQEATTAIYGGGTTAGHCSIKTKSAALAPTKEGGLVVLDQGSTVTEESEPPPIKPQMYRFGPGGSGCPGPAALARLKSGASEVTEVAAGTSVTLDASGSETTGRTVESLAWKIETPGGTTEEVPVPGPTPSLQVAHVFSTQGTYEVSLVVKTSSVPEVGQVFTSAPRKLIVTAGGGTPAPTVTAITPTHGAAGGGTVVHVTGTELTGTTGVKFGTVAGAEVTQVSATEVTAKSPAGTAGSTVDVVVTTPGGSSATSSADHFTYDGGAPGAPTVTAITPTHGTAGGGTVVHVTGTELTGATGVKFGTVAATDVTEVSATEVTAKSPAGTAGSIVDVVVTTAGGSSATGSADRFTYDNSTFSFGIVKSGTGSGTVSCNGVSCATAYTAGTTLTLSATPSAGSTFVGWSGGGCAGTGACTVVLNGPAAVTAVFNLTPLSNTPPDNSTPPSSGGTPPSNPAPPGGGTKTKTPAQLLKEKQQKALKKCQKLHGKAKVQCVKKAKQIGKPKPKPKAHKK